MMKEGMRYSVKKAECTGTGSETGTGFQIHGKTNICGKSYVRGEIHAEILCIRAFCREILHVIRAFRE